MGEKLVPHALKYFSQCFKTQCYQLITTVIQVTHSVQNVTMLIAIMQAPSQWNRKHI